MPKKKSLTEVIVGIGYDSDLNELQNIIDTLRVIQRKRSEKVKRMVTTITSKKRKEETREADHAIEG